MQNEVAVMSVIRVPPMGKLVVEALGERYETIEDVTDEAVGRLINAAIAELVVFAGGYEKLVRSGLAPPLAAGQAASGAVPASLAERQAAFEEALEQQREQTLATASGPAAEASASPVSIPDQINPLIQKHMATNPELAGHVVKLEQDARGNLNVIADGKVYERPDLIPDPAIRKAIRAALSEWDRT